MQDVNLALNEVTEAGADSLAAFLQGRTALQRLVLRENELGDDGAIALAGALQVGCMLACWRTGCCASHYGLGMHCDE
jgi:Leucine Rich repeat